MSKDFGAVYIIAHTGELLGQQVGGLESVGARWAYVRAGHLGDQTAPVQVCSSATMVRRQIVPPLDREGRPYRRCIVIVDEGHRVRSATLAAILAGVSGVYEFVYVVVQTGTPYRTDGRGMADACDVLVEATTPRELVANGWLCDPVFYSRPIYDAPDGPPPAAGGAGDEGAGDEVERGGVAAAGGEGGGDDEAGDGSDEDDDLRGVADFSAQSSKLCGDVVREWKRLGEGAPTVLRAVNRHHARSLAERFRAAGVRAATIGGDTPHAQRELLYGGLAIGGAGSSHPLALDVL
jgi:superfamily II DNA or RNA helicase